MSFFSLQKGMIIDLFIWLQTAKMKLNENIFSLFQFLLVNKGLIRLCIMQLDCPDIVFTQILRFFFV